MLLKIKTQDAGARAAGVLSLLLPGDSLLYLILPAAAASFGLSPFQAGLALALNRLVRMAGANRLAAELIGRYGKRRVAFWAAATGAPLTLAYGFAEGILIFIVLRLSWGLAYAALRLTSLEFALRSESPATELGRTHGIQALGPLLALVLGGSLAGLMDPHYLFMLCGLPAFMAPVLAWTLPRDTPDENSRQERKPFFAFAGPGVIEFLVFIASLGANGILVVSLSKLLMLEGLSLTQALSLGGLILGARRFLAVFMGPIAGWTAKQWGFAGPFHLCLTLLSAGFLLSWLGFIWPGLVLLTIFIGPLHVFAPGLLANRTPGTNLAPLARLNSWNDMGTALGPLLAGLFPDSAPGLLGALVPVALPLLLLSLLQERRLFSESRHSAQWP